MSDAVVTVVMPAYNAEKTLLDAIGSVREQTLQEFELVVVDDGSRDGTAEVATEIAGIDPRVRLIRQENAGLSAARNAGLRVANTRYVAFLDSDDLFHPEYLSQTVSGLDANPTAAYAHVDAWVFDDESRRLRRRPAMWRQRAPATALISAADAFEFLCDANYVWVGATVRASVLDKVGVFREDLRAAEDLDLWLRVASFGYDSLHIEERLGFYRSHQSQMSRDYSKMAKAIFDVFDYAERAYPLDTAARICTQSAKDRWQKNWSNAEARGASGRRRFGAFRERLRPRSWYREPPLPLRAELGPTLRAVLRVH